MLRAATTIQKEHFVMSKRVLTLAAVVAALAVPAISMADDGGSGAPATHDGSKLSARLDRVTARVNERFSKFSSRCLVANAPKQCERIANRAVRRMDRAESFLTKVETKIKAKCAEASPPAACAKAGEITGKIDALVSILKSDEAAIKAVFPNAGSGNS
jgi:hypothetical protein